MDKIICIGKNYLDHAKELGDAVPEKPVIFFKPPSVLRRARKWGDTLKLSLPQNRGEVHYECELVILISKDGARISEAKARNYIGGATVGLDMTLRGVQSELKKNGHPWEMGKVFKDSAVMGPFLKPKKLQELIETPFRFKLGGRIVQEGRASQMRMSIPQLISYASEYFPLCKGDVLFTGTPAGVGPVSTKQKGQLELGSKKFQVIWS